MSARPSITIAIITCGRPDSLAHTLASLKALVLPEGVDVSLLVVDNDPARSAEHAVSSAAMPFPVRYVVEGRRGIPHARNRALAEAMESDFIAFIDDDDIADSGWLDALYRCAVACRAEVVKGRVVHTFDEQHAHFSVLDIFAPDPTPTGTELDSAWTNNVLFSTRLCREMGLRFDPVFTHTGGSDHHFFRRAKRHGASIVMCHEAVVESRLPACRARWQWIARRHLRIGATMTASDIMLEGYGHAIRRVVHAMGDSGRYAFRLFRHALSGTHPVMHPMMVCCFMAGRVLGLLRLAPQEYKPRKSVEGHLRIAYVLGRFPVMSETFIGQEIRAMEQAGHRVTLVALHPPEGEYQPEDAPLAARTLYFPCISSEESTRLLRKYFFTFRRILPYALSQTTEPLRAFLVHAAHMAEHLKTNGCQHVHAHFAWGAATYAIAAARLLGIPVSFTCHGSDVYARPLDLELKCRWASAVIAVAPTITADVQKISPKTPCHTVYCGVDTGRFAPLADASLRHARWLFVGRMVDCKGLDDVLHAWALLPQPSRPALDVVGDGELRESLQSLAETLGVQEHVRFLGAKNSAWLCEHGPAYRALIAPFRQGGNGSRDTAPMVLKEAMAMALPIVTTQFIDIPHLVGEECAILCPPNAPATLADAVMQVEALADAGRRLMGMAGRARVEKYFSVPRQIEQLSRLLGA
ncbi:MAG: glycosyltransferase [Alphaproteobacteria bacterium]|nr:glycosyltransferase [Alphaproteobacteria bacterium]